MIEENSPESLIVAKVCVLLPSFSVKKAIYTVQSNFKVTLMTSMY